MITLLFQKPSSPILTLLDSLSLTLIFSDLLSSTLILSDSLFITLTSFNLSHLKKILTLLKYSKEKIILYAFISTF